MVEPVGEDRQIKFLFEFDPGYRVVGANGIWAGITPRGDLRLDFFVESQRVPDEVAHLITKEGKLGPELRRSGASTGATVVRRMQVGVLLSLEQADSIADFIKTKIADFKKKAKDAGSEGE